MSGANPAVDLESFDREGYMIIEDFFDDETIEEARHGIQRLVDREAE